MCRKTFAKRPSRRRRRGGRSVRVFPRRSVRGRQTERALEPQQTGLRVHLDPELADLLARLAQAGLGLGERNGFETTSEKPFFFDREERACALPDVFREKTKRAGLSFITHQELASQPRSLRLLLPVHRDDDTRLRLGVRRDRRAPARVRQVLPQLRIREEGAVRPGGVVARELPRASGGNETGRTFALCCASSWFTITRRLNVVCCGAGCVAEGGSGARGRACHGVSRMEHVLRSFRDARRRLREAEGDRKTAQRNELRTI